MADYLSPPAAIELLDLIKKSYFGELCAWSETQLRLVALAVLSGPCEEEKIAKRILAMDDFPIDASWCEEGEVERDEGAPSCHEGPGQTEVQFFHPDWPDDDEPPILQLIPAASIGLSDWVFHQADADYFPSIPHGHWKGRAQPKLDPYTGWIYKDSNKTRREQRRKIVALWNDQKFRQFASDAIDYYLGAYPYYGGWRVRNPRRLPRRR